VLHPAIERFAKVIDNDRALQEELWAITDPMQFVAAVVRSAKRHGITLVDGEVWEAFNAGRMIWLATQAP
jgi:hypothetical protein